MLEIHGCKGGYEFEKVIGMVRAPRSSGARHDGALAHKATPEDLCPRLQGPRE